MDFSVALLKSGIALATPLLLVALGEIVSERAGVLNIGVEGIMLTAAFAGVAGAHYTGNPWIGLPAAVGAGILAAALFEVMAVRFRADQVLVGTGLNIFALGLTGTALKELWGGQGATVTVATIPAWNVPGLSNIPVLGRTVFSQDAVVYAALAFVPLVAHWLFRTPSGLALRAAGENPEAAESVGLSVEKLRRRATLICGAFCGLAGGHLSLGLSNTFNEGMTAGRGFIALAIVIVSRWNPWGALAGALVFGTGTALQYQFQASGIQIPFQFVLMLPYVLTLVVAAIFSKRGGAPAALGRAHEPD